MAWLALLGPFSVCIMLLVFGVLSRRLGRVTHAAPYYLGFLVGAALVASALVVRIMYAAHGTIPPENIVWTFTYHLLFSSGVTLGLIAAWRYWSWLLAERD